MIRARFGILKGIDPLNQVFMRLVSLMPLINMYQKHISIKAISNQKKSFQTLILLVRHPHLKVGWHLCFSQGLPTSFGSSSDAHVRSHCSLSPLWSDWTGTSRRPEQVRNIAAACHLTWVYHWYYPICPFYCDICHNSHWYYRIFPKSNYPTWSNAHYRIGSSRVPPVNEHTFGNPWVPPLENHLWVGFPWVFHICWHMSSDWRSIKQPKEMMSLHTKRNKTRPEHPMRSGMLMMLLIIRRV